MRMPLVRSCQATRSRTRGFRPRRAGGLHTQGGLQDRAEQGKPAALLILFGGNNLGAESQYTY
jgi:hypothetical protein